jgi:hypothetical protein
MTNTALPSTAVLLASLADGAWTIFPFSTNTDSCDQVEPRHLVGSVEQSDQRRQWAGRPLVSTTYPVPGTC